MNHIGHYSFSGIEVSIFTKDKGSAEYVRFTNAEIVKGQKVKIEIKNTMEEPVIVNVALDSGLYQGQGHTIKQNRTKEYVFKIINKTFFEDFSLKVIPRHIFEENSFTAAYDLSEEEEEETLRKEKIKCPAIEGSKEFSKPLAFWQIFKYDNLFESSIGTKRKRRSEDFISVKARKLREEKSPQESIKDLQSEPRKEFFINGSLISRFVEQIKHCLYYLRSSEPQKSDNFTLDETTVLDDSYSESSEWTLLDGSPLP